MKTMHMKISVEVFNSSDDLDIRWLKVRHLATLLLMLQTASLWYVSQFLSNTVCEYPKYQTFIRQSLPLQGCAFCQQLSHSTCPWRQILLLINSALFFTPPHVLLTGVWRYLPKDAVKKHWKNKLVKNHSTSSSFMNHAYFSQFMNKCC